ncbi:hypothetical protein F4604DRAFT_1926485 [Suillus subluteus]|nr:hypothetical protein F4604DRAFT_1926485 [Suillus subluteus]
MAIIITSTEEPLDLANRTSFFHDNVVVMEVDNLLAGWLTYTLNFTPERPGPLKLILRLKDTSKFRSTEDNDSKDEGMGGGKEDADATMVCKAPPRDVSQRFSAQPVRLHGLPKDSPSIVAIRCLNN